MQVRILLNLLKDHLSFRKSILPIFLIAFSLFLFYSDFPLPHGDDLFFAGTSVHYAQTGNFLNPGVLDYTAEFSEIQKPYWFVPLHMRTLGWWLYLTDISDQSIRIYILLCIIITSLVFIKWSKISLSEPKIIPYLIPIIVTFGFRWSLRPESTAIPLWTIGAFLIFHSCDKKKFWFGVSFLGLACLASQILFIPSACIVLASLTKKSERLPLIFKCQVILICVVQTLFLGACLINFEIAEFVQMFSDHIEARSSSIYQNLSLFYFLTCKLGNGYFLRFPSFVLLIIAFVPVLKWQGSNRPFLMGTLLSLVLMIFIYAKSFEIILFLVTIFTLIAVFELKKNIITFLTILTILVFFRQGLYLCTYDFFCDRAKRYESLVLDNKKTYVIDEFTIRHPLNWQFPEKWKIAPDFGTTNDRLLRKPKSEIWVMSYKNLSYFYPDLYQQEKIMFGNKQFVNLPVKFWNYSIIP
tara:strand:+ start:2324 stop:3727 length:1404 start_codon:yes stop_codon:yes gene_type:complete